MSHSFQLACEASIKKVELTAKIKKSQVVRVMRIRLEREFDAVMARAIGGRAPDILEQLKDLDQEKAVMAIDDIVARLELHVAAVGVGKGKPADDMVVIPRVLGRKATAAAPKTEEDIGPTIILEFEFAFAEEAWAWFGRNMGGFATIDMSPAQLKFAQAS